MAGTSPLKLAMVFTADNSPVKNATAETRKDVAGVGAEAATAETKMRRLVDTAGGLHIGGDGAAQLARLRAAFDPVFAAQARYKQNLEEIARAEKAGLGGAAAIEARLREERAYQSAMSLADRQAAARKAATQAMVDRQTIVPNRSADITAVLEQRHDLRAKYSPMYAAVTEYKAAIAEMREAQRVGAISTDEMTAAISRQRQATLASIDAIKGRNSQLKGGSSGHNSAATNVAYQAQDVITQAAMGGTSSVMIGLQQGPQAAMSFAGMNGKQALATLGAGVAALATPVSLAAIGITTAAAAAVSFGASLLGAADDTNKLDDALDAHTKTLARLEKAYGGVIAGAKSYGRENLSMLDAVNRKTIRDLVNVGKTENSSLINSFELSGWITGGGSVVGIERRFEPFRAELLKLREQARAGKPDFEAFYASVEKTASLSPQYRKVADELILLTENAKSATDAIAEQERVLKSLFNAIGPSGRLLSQGTLAKEDADNFTLYQSRQAVEAQRRQNAYEAQIAELNARSPSEKAAAARLNAAATHDDSEDAPERRNRIETAGKLALAQAEKQLRDAQEQRLRSLDGSVTSQQLELSLIGKTVTETERLRMEYQLTAQLKEEAARTNTEVDQTELDLIRQQSEAYGRLAETIASANMLRDQARTLETARAELSLASASDETRRRSLALLQAEQQLQERGISATSEAANRYRQQALEISEVNAQIARQADAWDMVRSTGESTIDTLFDKLTKGDFEGALESIASDWSKTLLTLGAANPMKNAWLGTDLPTLSDAGGLSGIVSKLFGVGDQSVGAMNVNAGSVVISGGIAGGLGSIPGLVPANDNGTNVIPFPGKSTGNPLGFVGNYKSGADPRLTDILSKAALASPDFKVDAISGFRSGDPRFHGKGLATDIQLTDLVSGRRLGNYQDAQSFSAYERFAQTARSIQMRDYPELANQFRWGGYFGGGKGKYGALDTMHFDLGGAGMAGGSWQSGLTSAQRNLWPGIESSGSAAVQALNKLAGQTDTAAQGLGTLGTGFDKFGSMLGSAGAGGGGAGGGLFGNLFGALFSPQYRAAMNGTLGVGLFDRGGYTGAGGLYEPAGIVHRGEIVWSQRDIARAGGVAVVDAMRLGRRGYASGGIVDVTPFPMVARQGANSNQQGGGSFGGFSQVIHNYSGQEVRTEETSDGRGGKQQSIIIGEPVAAAVKQRGNPLRQALQSEFALRPQRVSR